MRDANGGQDCKLLIGDALQLADIPSDTQDTLKTIIDCIRSKEKIKKTQWSLALDNLTIKIDLDKEHLVRDASNAEQRLDHYKSRLILRFLNKRETKAEN